MEKAFNNILIPNIMEDKTLEILVDRIKGAKIVPISAGGQVDCRYCKHYSYEQDVELESCKCEKGYFNSPFGDMNPNINFGACKGKDFEFNNYFIVSKKE
ncbi:MAG: hypothetical protein WC867_03295 [Candidatus Pacearchaeota archaeon]